MGNLRHVKTFTGVAAKFAAAVGRRSDVNVTFGGNLNFTDGRNINLQALPSGTILTNWQEKVYSGALDHEVAHVRYTDFAAIGIDRKKEPLYSYLVNLVEDIRIEKRYMEDYPGAEADLNALALEVDRNQPKGAAGKEQPGSNQATPARNAAEKTLSLIYKEAWAKYRGVDSATIEGWLEQDPLLQPIAHYMATEMPNMRISADASLIAHGIKNRLPPDVDYSTLSGPGDLLEIVLGQPGGVSASVLAMEALSEAAAALGQIRDHEEIWEKLIANIQNTNAGLIFDKSKFTKMPWGDGILPPVGTEHDKIYVPPTEDLATFVKTRVEVAADITALKKSLSIYLRSRKHLAWSRGLEEGTLDHDALPSLMMGSRRIYKERRSREIIDTAVELLVDCSGSMPSHITRTAAIMLAEALDGIPRVNLAISGFTTNGQFYNSGRAGGRSEGMDLLLYKGWDEPLKKARGRLGAIRSLNSTPLGEAYGFAFEHIVVRRERRRILWIVSDGEPFLRIQDKRHSELNLMSQVHRKCRAAGVETLGLAIGDEATSLKRYVDKATLVTRHTGLAKAILGLAKGIIQTEAT